MLTVTISIILSLRGAFQGAAQFTRSYMGDYITCLMNYGELPSLGVEESDLKLHQSEGTQCNISFRNFTFADGRPPIGTIAAQSAQPNTLNQNGSNNNANNANNSDLNRSRQNKSTATGGSGAGASGLSGNNSTSTIRRNTLDGNTSTAGKVSVVDDGEGDAGELAGGRGRGRNESRPLNGGTRYRAITGALAEKIEKKSNRISKRQPSSTVVAKPGDDDLTGRGPKVNFIKPPEIRSTAIHENPDSNWELGAFLKWILIIAIIILILVFVGSQVLNYSNSDS